MLSDTTMIYTHVLNLGERESIARLIGYRATRIGRQSWQRLSARIVLTAWGTCGI